MPDHFAYCDDLGPAKVVELYDPKTGLRAALVVDNVAAGPAIGGVRMARDVSLEECFRLARAMTLKNAAAGLPHGGGKAVIFADPHRPGEEKERLIRAFARAIAEITDYIPGPDMGTDERAMAWVADEIGRAVGLPAVLGGIPLDEIGATARGLVAAAEVAQGYAGIELPGARLAVQGFGAVGRHAARLLLERGARLVAVADSSATLEDPQGLDLPALVAHKAAGRAFAEFHDGRCRDRAAVVTVDCDILIPAARPDVITAENVEQVQARLILEGANIPARPAEEARLHARGILVVPDFIANAGGVICAVVEYRGGTAAQAFDVIAEKLRANTRAVLERSQAEGMMPRKVAEAMARERVLEAMRLTRR